MKTLDLNEMALVQGGFNDTYWTSFCYTLAVGGALAAAIALAPAAAGTALVATASSGASNAATFIGPLTCL